MNRIADFTDQIFVNAKAWLLGFVPIEWQELASISLSILPITLVFPLLFAITTVLERKALGRIQNRLGPNRVGPFGLLQPIADGLKSLTKEDVVPIAADRFLHFLAPILLVVPVLLAFSVIPYGRNMLPLDLEMGLLFFFALGASSELAVFLAGWSSRNKYALLGAMRAIAQMISYEIPLILSVAPVVMLTGTLSTRAIVEAQAGYSGWIPNWHVLTPWGLVAFVLFLIAATAESNRSPFDLPEGESEIIAGYYIEYSGFKFALFFLGEYLGLFAVSGLAITLFLGGWHAPLPFLSFVPSYLWFFLKLFVLIAFFIWVRGTLPRLRMDQLMNLAWKFMLPMALLNILAASLWHFIGSQFWRWLLTALLLLLAYVLLGRGLTRAAGRGVRQYKFAT